MLANNKTNASWSVLYYHYTPAILNYICEEVLLSATPRSLKPCHSRPPTLGNSVLYLFEFRKLDHREITRF